MQGSLTVSRLGRVGRAGSRSAAQVHRQSETSWWRLVGVGAWVLLKGSLAAAPSSWGLCVEQRCLRCNICRHTRHQLKPPPCAGDYATRLDIPGAEHAITSDEALAKKRPSHAHTTPLKPNLTHPGGYATRLDIPGAEHAITSDEALALENLPGKSILIVGSG